MIFAEDEGQMADLDTFSNQQQVDDNATYEASPKLSVKRGSGDDGHVMISQNSMRDRESPDMIEYNGNDYEPSKPLLDFYTSSHFEQKRLKKPPYAPYSSHKKNRHHAIKNLAQIEPR